MATRKSNSRKAAVRATAPTAQPQAVETAVRQVSSLKEFKEASEELRSQGYHEVPGALGGGHAGDPKADYGEFINSRLACKEDGKSGKAVFPLLHVSSGYAQPVKAANGHEGSYITWGAGNRVPNIVSFFCSLSPYTAAALKFNIDLITGMGPCPMYSYTQYVGGNITHKTIPFETADKLILGMIRDLQLQLVKLESDHPELNEPDAGLSPEVLADGKRQSRARGSQRGSEQPQKQPPVQTTPAPPDSGGERKSAAAQMRDDINAQIESLRRDLAIWQQTVKEIFGDPEAKTVTEQVGFLGHNNLVQTFQQLYADMLQYNICFPEIELQQAYLDPDTGHEVKSFKWNPKAVGIKWRNAKTMRLEEMNVKNKNKIEHVYTSNQWLSSPEQTLPPQDGDFKIDALPALDPQAPASDLEQLARDARRANVPKKRRPSHVVLPVRYNEYGHPYYPVPAWYSVFSGDVYTYASLLISDRKKRRDNANVIGRVLYVSDEYIQRMYIQRHLDTPEQRRKFFNDEIVKPINDFLKNRDNMGEPMLAYTFKDADGKVYKSWEIVEIVDNDKSLAEANKEELAEISSIILFAWGVDSQLIGNTPGTTTRSGGTDLRERYLLKQVNMSLMQHLVLGVMNVVSTRNRWDPHLTWTIKKEVLTTLDNSKTGITEAETT